MMKKLIYLSFLLPLAGNAQTTVIKPSTKQATAFAIVTDNQTYANTKEAMHLYKDAVEADGLATYLISGDFKNPDEVKQEIVKVYNECPTLEGIVLVGDIPIALVRNAQHMTTAFKMREKAFPWDQSSVPTDRFYDDLNLKFEYLKQDSVNTDHFYYKLTEDSPQRLNPTFYSARIKYPEKKGGDNEVHRSPLSSLWVLQQGLCSGASQPAMGSCACAHLGRPVPSNSSWFRPRVSTAPAQASAIEPTQV